MGKNVDDLQSDSNYDSPSSKLPMIKKMDSTSSSQGSSQNAVPVAGVKQVMSPTKAPPTPPTNAAGNNATKRTQMNFYLQQDKQKMDAAAERLIHSVNAVTDLLKANTELRDTIEKMRRQKEDSDSEVFTLNIEN
jgi:regulator of replication initiation timing